MNVDVLRPVEKWTVDAVRSLADAIGEELITFDQISSIHGFSADETLRLIAKTATAAPAGAKKLNAHLWERHPEDWYVEPQVVWERFFAAEPFGARLATVYDPFCGYGRSCAAARDAGYYAIGSDIKPRWESDKAPKYEGDISAPNFRVADFTASWPIFSGTSFEWPDAIVSNIPFGIADQVVPLCLQRAPKVALLLPTTWANGAGTASKMRERGFYREYRIGPRPSMPPGPVIEAGEDPGGGKKDFSIFIFMRAFDGEPTIRFLDISEKRKAA